MNDPDLFKIIESEQEAECFECCEIKPIWAVQKVVSGNLTDKPQTFDSSKFALPPLSSGTSWQPTCQDCYEASNEDEDDDDD